MMEILNSEFLQRLESWEMLAALGIVCVTVVAVVYIVTSRIAAVISVFRSPAPDSEQREF